MQVCDGMPLPLSCPARDSRNARKRPSGDGVTTCGPGHGDRARHPRPGGEGRICRLTRVRPGPAAVLVMALGVLALLAAWLMAILRTARQPASGPAHPGREPHLPRGSRPNRAARTPHLRGTRTRRLGRPIRPRHRPGRLNRRLPAQPGRVSAPRDTRPGLTETPAGNTIRRLNGAGHQAAFAVASVPGSRPCGDIAAAHLILEHGERPFSQRARRPGL